MSVPHKKMISVLVFIDNYDGVKLCNHLLKFKVIVLGWYSDKKCIALIMYYTVGWKGVKRSLTYNCHKNHFITFKVTLSVMIRKSFFY